MKTEKMIRTDNCPIEESVKIFYPNGELIIETNDELMFYHVRYQIALEGKEGYYFEFRGEKYYFNHYGVVEQMPFNAFKHIEGYACKLLELGMKRRRAELGEKDEDE